MKGEWLRESDDTVIVFIHGILSSGGACWRHESGTYWPRLILQEEGALDPGVYVYSYKTGFFSGSYRVSDAVDDLKERLALDGVLACRTIVFVAHSMGGIVARKLLVERADDFRDINLGLFLVASPSLGSSYANVLAPLARLVGHSQADALRFSQSNAWLADLDKEFKNLHTSGRLAISGKELAEDVFIALPGLVRRQVVPPFSATAYFGEPYKVPDSNHFSIAKPVNADAIQHRLLVDFVQQVRAKLRPRIEPELRGRLDRRLLACSTAGLPFRAFHKLDAVFSMQTGFAASVLGGVKPGGFESVRDWLREAVRTQSSSEPGEEHALPPIEEDAHLEAAAELAAAERAKAVDERHLLLAILADRASGTVRQLAEFLGDAGFDRFVDATRSARPSAAKLSRTPAGPPIGGAAR
ncbi:alpha/beta hydrolase [Sphingomonas sp.]|uniref:lipase family alpha/beta hydrolase n=1 Tax=Sphingomonas sp. TaxID=28214 RepID=UPI002DE8C053|nr:alpha/beta hydrolase [Sphingomonas sp.]